GFIPLGISDEVGSGLSYFCLIGLFFSMSVDFYGIANPAAIFFFTLMIYWTISASRLFLFFFTWTGAILLIPSFRDSLFNSNNFIAFFLEAIVLNFAFYFGLRGSFIQKFVFLFLASCAVWAIHNILNYSLLFDLLHNVPLLVMILVASYLLILVRQGSFFYKIFRFILSEDN
ncbi:MAG: hypothetical protein Q7U74_03295, partial [Saprospiraceae bacterium]|nr:hypothetical protein [Saprospiraceae bacterium]